MPERKTRKPKVFYAHELTSPELKSFPELRTPNPSDEIAVLRILINRMLHVLNDLKSSEDTIQAVNTISYITGRLAKLCEVQNRKSEASPEFTTAYLLSLEGFFDQIRPAEEPKELAEILPAKSGL